MKQGEGNKLFEDFINEWGVPFSNFYHILKYIESYPQLRAQFYGFRPLTKLQLEQYQTEWLSLFSQLSHPIDTGFFKPYWVRLTYNDDYFVDLSDPNLPIFRLYYFLYEPHCWHKYFLIHNTNELLLSVDDSSIDIEFQKKQNERDVFRKIEELDYKSRAAKN